nr:MAG TPA: hypothetical protein [Caudoviricetes sp.]
MDFQAAYDGVKNAADKVNKLVNMVFGIGGTTVGQRWARCSWTR